MPFFDVQKLKGRGQPQLGGLFIFSIPAIPSLVGGDAQAIEIQTREVEVPGVRNTKIEVVYYGFVVKYNGFMEYDGELTTPFLLMEDKAMYNTIRKWVNLAQSEEDGGGQKSAAIKTRAFIRGYSIDGVTVTGAWEFTGVFPTTCPPIAFAQEGQQLEIEAVWSYDTQKQIS